MKPWDAKNKGIYTLTNLVSIVNKMVCKNAKINKYYIEYLRNHKKILPKDKINLNGKLLNGYSIHDFLNLYAPGPFQYDNQGKILVSQEMINDMIKNTNSRKTEVIKAKQEKSEQNKQNEINNFNQNLAIRQRYDKNESIIKNNMKLTESKLHNILVETINNILSEITDIRQLKSKQSIVNAIYRVTQPYTSKIYRDDYWQGVRDIRDVLSNMGVDCEIEVPNGGYRNIKGGGEVKEYYFHLTINNKIEQTYKFDFILVASQAGSMENPWSAYDLTFYRIN